MKFLLRNNQYIGELRKISQVKMFILYKAGRRYFVDAFGTFALFWKKNPALPLFVIFKILKPSVTGTVTGT